MAADRTTLILIPGVRFALLIPADGAGVAVALRPVGFPSAVSVRRPVHCPPTI